MIEINITKALEKQVSDMQKVNKTLLGLKSPGIISIPSGPPKLPK